MLTIKNTQNFLDNKVRNAWIKDGYVNAYLRHSNRPTSAGTTLQMLDIANVNVREDKQRQGHFKAWYMATELAAIKAGIKAIYVESVLSYEMECFCECNGFSEVGDENNCNYLKIIST